MVFFSARWYFASVGGIGYTRYLGAVGFLRLSSQTIILHPNPFAGVEGSWPISWQLDAVPLLFPVLYNCWFLMTGHFV